MDFDGILGRKQSFKGSNPRKKWIKTQEMWLVVLGVILHAVYMLSIFDIYFKTPIVHGMDSVTPRFKAPAKRLVLLDGKLIQLNLIRFLIKASIRFLMVAQILFRYFVEPCHTTPKILFLMTMKTLQLSLLNWSNEDLKLKELLLQDNRVISLHLLGFDSDGHAHWPFSSIYLNKVKVVDHIAKLMCSLLEGYFKHNRTTYVFTCIMGCMTKHAHDTPTPKEWGLDGIERVDVNQADIAPIMSTRLGLPCPVNSVGNLPLEYIKMNEVSAADFIEK
ncbi:hypothetical protein Patl1_21955 [Pistacia atlantica]|uniref:Uncharacterized protein n=1 Tax=Pistacia atlantica TaxID=434234 RepID=A0ACC1BJB8_9ROSI|nr:hypothetical protein Patl1_21955 [Pistacia atlantica]